VEAEEDASVIDVALAMDDFLRQSPVFSAKPRPVDRKKKQAPVPVFDSPAALAVAALAADVGSLDVPEGQRAGARAALLDRHGASRPTTSRGTTCATRCSSRWSSRRSAGACCRCSCPTSTRPPEPEQGSPDRRAPRRSGRGTRVLESAAEAAATPRAASA
jgi:hypothetical protein